jgi:hypothetical protein
MGLSGEWRVLRYVRASCTGIARGVVRQRIYSIKQHSRTASFIDLDIVR